MGWLSRIIDPSIGNALSILQDMIWRRVSKHSFDEKGWGLENILGGNIHNNRVAFKQKLLNRFPVVRRLPWFFFLASSNVMINRLIQLGVPLLADKHNPYHQPYLLFPAADYNLALGPPWR